MRWYVKVALLVVVGLGGCKGCDDETPEPVQPQLSAAFKFYDQVGPYGSVIGDPRFKLIETDTFYLAKAGGYDSFRVIYQATDTSADSYSWKVGDDPRNFTGRASALNFDAPGLYPVTLKVTRTAKNGLVSKDSLTRNFRIIRTEYHPIIGKYIGYNVSNPDSLFKFFIGHGYEGIWPWIIDTMKQQSGNAGYIMTGLNGSKYCSHGIALSTKGGFCLEAANEWPAFIGNYNLKQIFLIPNRSFDSITIDYIKYKIPVEQDTKPAQFVPERFIGKRYL